MMFLSLCKLACFFFLLSQEFFSTERVSDKPFDELQRVFNEREISVITNTIKKLWLEDFYRFCMGLGGETALVMGPLLSFEADRR